MTGKQGTTNIFLDKERITSDELVAVARHNALSDFSSEGEARVDKTST